MSAMINGTIAGGQVLKGEMTPRGNDGISPTVEVKENENGHVVEITDVKGKKSFEVKDGYTPRKNVDYFDGVSVTHEWNGTTLKVKSASGESAADLKGEKGDPFVYSDFTTAQLAALKGEKGDPGYTPIKGKDYVDGKDGYTPRKNVDYFDGEKGDPGYTPVKGKDYFDGKDGYTPVKGKDYFDGKDGYTPVKGKDYFDGEKGDPGDDGFSVYLYRAEKDAEIGKQYTLLLDGLELNGNTLKKGDFVFSLDGKVFYVEIVGVSDYFTCKYIMDLVGPIGPKGGKGDKPVKGVDYFTTEEKQSIKQEIINSIGEGRMGIGQNVAGMTFVTDEGETVTAADGAERFNDYMGNRSLGQYAHAEGFYTTASGDFSHAEGNFSKASGFASHAEGDRNTASGSWSHAEGNESEASGDRSHAEGNGTVASGSSSHAEGRDTKSTGDYSHAEGYGTTASGYISHAEGNGCVADSAYAHAEGDQTLAGNVGAHAEGIGTIAQVMASHVEGKYNVEDKQNKYAHILGNGTTDDQRSNAHTVDWNGNAWFAGNVYVGGTSMDDPNAKVLGTGGSGGVQTVNGVKPDASGNVEIEVGSGSGVEVTAKPGQLIRVKEVDENGNPTAWEAAEDMPWAEGGRVEVLAECQPPYNEDTNFVISDSELPFVVGETYIVNWNGVEYHCVAHDISALIPNGVVLGNVPEFNLIENNGEPFYIMVAEMTVCGWADGSTDAITISIYADGEVVHPLDTKYLPEGVPYVYKDYILEETDAVETTDPSFGKTWRIVGAPSLSVGETYTVIYNGVPYDCVCQPGESLGMSMANGGFILGNSAAVGGANTGEPFAMLILPAYQMIINMDLTGATSVRIGIMGKVGHKMDDRCIPDSTRVLVVKFAEREDGNLVSLSHTYLQMRHAINEGIPVVCFVNYHDGYGSTAIFGCYAGDSWIKGSDDEEYWWRGWEYDKYYLDGDTSNKTIGNEIWGKSTP